MPGQTLEIDMENRDPNNMNDQLKVCWEDVMGEPSGVRSADCVWSNSYKCFECGKSLCYMLLTTLCGICIALYWGCNFGIVAFNHIWCYSPMLRDFSICISFFQRLYGTIINCCCAPFCEACGGIFSRMQLTRK